MISSLAQDGLHEISDILHKIRKSVKYVQETTLGKEKFQYAVSQLYNLQGKKITSEDFPTSWVSSFLMLESALEFQQAFSYVENEDREFTVNPSREEWAMAVNVHKCLKVLYDVICRLSKSKCLTANLYFPEVCHIGDNLLSLQMSEHQYILVMARKMKVKFEKYFFECRTILVIAEILDPRRKLSFLKFTFERFYGLNAETQLALILNDLNGLFDDYVRDASANMASDYGDGHLLSTWYISTHGVTSAILQRAELNRYLEESCIHTEGEFDILRWWHTSSQNFPTLGKMACDILTISMSICTSNYAFSPEAMTINPAFDGHDPDIVEALICGEDWLEKPKINAPNNGDKLLHADYFLDRERRAHSSQLSLEPSLGPMLQEKPASSTTTNTQLLLNANPSSHCAPTYPITILHEPPSSTLPSANPFPPLGLTFSPSSSSPVSPAPTYQNPPRHYDLRLGLNS